MLAAGEALLRHQEWSCSSGPSAAPALTHRMASSPLRPDMYHIVIIAASHACLFPVEHCDKSGFHASHAGTAAQFGAAPRASKPPIRAFAAPICKSFQQLAPRPRTPAMYWPRPGPSRGAGPSYSTTAMQAAGDAAASAPSLFTQEEGRPALPPSGGVRGVLPRLTHELTRFAPQ